MPYIKNCRREKIDKKLNLLIKELKQLRDSSTQGWQIGDISYIIVRLAHEWLKYRGLKYKFFNEVIGVLECTKLELYRATVAPYEEAKRKRVGSVSTLDY